MKCASKRSGEAVHRRSNPRGSKAKIVLLAGARQAGKTTLSRQLGLRHAYLNVDSAEDRRLLREKQWDRQVELVIFDELHKVPRWKAWLKGVYDTEGTLRRSS